MNRKQIFELILHLILSVFYLFLVAELYVVSYIDNAIYWIYLFPFCIGYIGSIVMHSIFMRGNGLRHPELLFQFIISLVSNGKISLLKEIDNNVSRLFDNVTQNNRLMHSIITIYTIIQLLIGVILSPLLSVMSLFESNDVFIHDIVGLLYQSLLVIPFIIYEFIWYDIMKLTNDQFLTFVCSLSYFVCDTFKNFGQPFDM